MSRARYLRWFCGESPYDHRHCSEMVSLIKKFRFKDPPKCTPKKGVCEVKSLSDLLFLSGGGGIKCFHRKNRALVMTRARNLPWKLPWKHFHNLVLVRLSDSKALQVRLGRFFEATCILTWSLHNHIFKLLMSYKNCFHGKFRALIIDNIYRIFDKENYRVARPMWQ